MKMTEEERLIANEANRVYCNAEIAKAIVKKIKEAERKPLPDKVIIYAVAEGFKNNEVEMNSLQKQHENLQSQISEVERSLNDRKMKDDLFRKTITEEVDKMGQDEFERWSKVILGEQAYSSLFMI